MLTLLTGANDKLCVFLSILSFQLKTTYLNLCNLCILDNSLIYFRFSLPVVVQYPVR